jgi:MYXO-CTERM domain-containing protein
MIRPMLISASVACTVVTLSAQAGSLNNAFSTSMFGLTRPVSVYRVGGDLAPSGPRLEPEGMVWFNGDLYASGDANTLATPGESNGFIARYIGGNLASTPVAVGQFTVVNGTAGARPVGPEGITVNTRGSGYGSFAGSQPTLVAVDGFSTPTGRIVTTLNTANGTTAGTIGAYPINSDDIAFVPGADAASDRFAFIDGTGGANQLRFVSAADGFTALSGTFNLPNQSKGLVYLPASEAAWFGFAQDAFLVAISPDFAGDTNKLNLYSITGTLLASEALPTGNAASGLFQNAESLAWDPATQRLFIGDENGATSQIAVVTVPTPGAATMLGLGALAATRRRRAR